jgi:PIN domain nuclease of toxin-antitoxin system
MKALLDTHAFLWAISGDEKLSQRAGRIFTSPSDLWLSIASIWEILVKVQVGKIQLPIPAGPYILKKMVENKIETLPVSLDHVLRIESLPLLHSDPFDRMLIAQSLEEKLPLVTADRVFAAYQVDVIW